MKAYPIPQNCLIVAFSGNIGTGKTTLVNQIKNQIGLYNQRFPSDKKEPVIFKSTYDRSLDQCIVDQYSEKNNRYLKAIMKQYDYFTSCLLSNVQALKYKTDNKKNIILLDRSHHDVFAHCLAYKELDIIDSNMFDVFEKKYLLLKNTFDKFIDITFFLRSSYKNISEAILERDVFMKTSAEGKATTNIETKKEMLDHKFFNEEMIKQITVEMDKIFDENSVFKNYKSNSKRIITYKDITKLGYNEYKALVINTHSMINNLLDKDNYNF